MAEAENEETRPTGAFDEEEAAERQAADAEEACWRAAEQEEVALQAAAAVAAAERAAAVEQEAAAATAAAEAEAAEAAAAVAAEAEAAETMAAATAAQAEAAEAAVAELEREREPAHQEPPLRTTSEVLVPDSDEEFEMSLLAEPEPEGGNERLDAHHVVISGDASDETLDLDDECSDEEGDFDVGADR